MERHAEFLDLLVGDRVQLAKRSGEDQRAGAEVGHLKTVERVDELVTCHNDGIVLQHHERPVLELVGEFVQFLVVLASEWECRNVLKEYPALRDGAYIELHSGCAESHQGRGLGQDDRIDLRVAAVDLVMESHRTACVLPGLHHSVLYLHDVLRIKIPTLHT